MPALRGAEGMLKRYKPIVFTECNSVDDGVATLLLMKQFGYVGFGCLTAAFNQQNFSAHQTNMFGDSKESGLISIDESCIERFSEIVELLPLPRLERFDDLALLLNYKPQYPAEILAGSNTGRVFGLDYPSPLAAKLRRLEGVAADLDALSAQLSRTNAALAETQVLAVERAKEIDHLSQRLTTTQAALVETQTLAVERTARSKVWQSVWLTRRLNSSTPMPR